MLHEEQHVAESSRPPLFYEGALQRQRVGIRHRAEAANFKWTHRVTKHERGLPRSHEGVNKRPKSTDTLELDVGRVPLLEGALDVRHELVGDGAINDPVVVPD